MIYTVTANPAIDEIITVDHLKKNGVSDIKSVEKYMGGKGVNTGRALKSLGKKSRVLVLLASSDRDFVMDECKKEDMEILPFCFEGHTRISRTIVFQGDCFNTHLKEKGSFNDKKAPGELKKYLQQNLKDGDYLMLSGSLPEGLDEYFYSDLIEDAKKKNVLTFLDTSGLALEKGIESVPFCLKVNLDEFIEFSEQSKTDVADFKMTAKALFKYGISLIIITMGSEGAVLYDGENFHHARVKLEKNNFEQSYGVGSGDSFFAGFVSAMQEEKDIKECMIDATACGAANALMTGSARFNLGDVKSMMENVQISKEV